MTQNRCETLTQLKRTTSHEMLITEKTVYIVFCHEDWQEVKGAVPHSINRALSTKYSLCSSNAKRTHTHIVLPQVPPFNPFPTSEMTSEMKILISEMPFAEQKQVPKRDNCLTNM